MQNNGRLTKIKRRIKEERCKIEKQNEEKIWEKMRNANIFEDHFNF